MNILIDFTQIPLERTGVGVYADHLVAELPALLGPLDTLFLLMQDDDLSFAQHWKLHPQVRLLTLPARWFRNRLALLLFEQCILPWLLARHRIHVCHSLHYTFPLFAPCARAVTVHDLTFSLFPELHTRGRRLLFPFFIRQALARAECPIFVSHATARDAERLFGPSQHPGYVTQLGVEPAPPMDPDAADAALRSLGIAAPFLLFVGTLEPRKNVARIVEAFEQIAPGRPQLMLVLAGKLGWHTEAIVSAIERSPYRNRIRHLGFITEAHKGALLHRCAMLVYPSLYEGFGLPVLEAMAQGAPVITSNVSSMPEIAGEAALLVDPLSTASIATAMERLANDSELAQVLRRKGQAQASLFTWKRASEATYQAYLAAMGARGSL